MKMGSKKFKTIFAGRSSSECKKESYQINTYKTGIF